MLVMTEWYDNAVIYQLYPKSFQDSNGDGIGDLNGIRQRVPYLQSLGITAVWLNPVFVSPQVDNGYDVANYYAIDPTMGTMADMAGLIHDLHAAGIRVIMDFVLNHTSDQHPWFQDAISDPHSIYRDYYIFDGKNGQRPNNWGSFFGGSVWEPDPAGTGQSYFHLFDKHMPDLNWANPEVRHAMTDVALYWLAKGIDGLRLDAFIHIAKADLRQNYPSDDADPVVAEPFFANLPQVQTWLRPFCAQIKADYPHALLLGEAASANVNLAVDYTSQHSALMDSVITFRYFPTDTKKIDPAYPAEFQPQPLDWAAFKQTQTVWQQTLSHVSLPTLYWNNHDMARVKTRVAHNETQAKSLALLMYLQRGLPIIYYGEELGLPNITLDQATVAADPAVQQYLHQATAAGCSQAAAKADVSATHKLAARGPMPWTAEATMGFTTGTPWLTSAEPPAATVASEEQDPASMLHWYRQLIALKKQPVFAAGDWYLLPTVANAYVYQRELGDERRVVAVNLGDEAVTLDLPVADLHVILATTGCQGNGQQVTLPPYAGCVLSNEE